MNLSLWIDLVFVWISLRIGLRALSAYMRAPKNHEFMFYWGMSFVTLAFLFCVYAIHPIFPIKGTSWSTNILMTFVFLLQLCGIIMAAYEDSDKRVVINKISRGALMAFMLLTMFLSPLAITNLSIGRCSELIPITQSTIKLQIVGIHWIDYSVEIFKISLTIAAIALMPKALYWVRLAYCFLAISDGLQLINLFFYDYSYTMLFDLEWAAALVTIILLYYGMGVFLRGEADTA